MAETSFHTFIVRGKNTRRKPCVWCVSHPLCACVLQVQLLVSEQDVENYKQIKTDLDQLRLTVEKSELWVEKSGGYSGEELGVRQGKEQNLEVPNHTSSIQAPNFTLKPDIRLSSEKKITVFNTLACIQLQHNWLLCFVIFML